MPDIFWAYRGRINPLIEVPSTIRDRWLANTQTERERIVTALLTTISSEADFKEKLAGPSSERFASFVSDDYPQSFQIESKHKVKLARAYEPWNDHVGAAFADGENPGAFLRGLEEGLEGYKAAKYTLRCLGDREYLGLKPVSKAVSALFGDSWMIEYHESPYDEWIHWERHCSPIRLKYRRVGRPAFLALLTRGVNLISLCASLDPGTYPEWIDWLHVVQDATNNKAALLLAPMLTRRNGNLVCGEVVVDAVKLYLRWMIDGLYVVAEVLYTP